jgi:putative sulfotransferase
MSVPTFVVGTGRCGSTMLSNMLREHPDVLSLSEFFSILSDGGHRIPEMFPPQMIDGRTFSDLISGVTSWNHFLLKNCVEFPEALYPYQSPSARYSAETGVPAILLTTLPHLTADHDALFDVLKDEVFGWPTATIGEHYRHLFRWLSKRFGKHLWIERSGGVLLMAEPLFETFLDARIVHIVRDGRDTALSMCEHSVFRLSFLMNSIEQHLGVHPIWSFDRTKIDLVPADLRPFLPESFDLQALRAVRMPAAFGGALWSQQIDNSFKALSRFPADRLLLLRYEDFFIDPKGQLDTLAAFLGDDFVDEAWSTRCAFSVRKPRSTWRDLPADEARALTEACRPGFDLLATAGVHYDV